MCSLKPPMKNCHDELYDSEDERVICYLCNRLVHEDRTETVEIRGAGRLRVKVCYDHTRTH